MEKIIYTLEADVDDFVKRKFDSLKLRKGIDYNEKSVMSSYMKEALKGAAKTRNKKSFGQPDFHIEKYQIPVVIENKLYHKFHIAVAKEEIKADDKSVSNYAVNGAVYYARSMIESKRYDEVIAIGISGESDDSIKISTYYVFSSNIKPKFMKDYNSLDFLESEESFNAFYDNAVVTEDEKHKILIKTREELIKHAKVLNKMMNNQNIGVEQRVVYVSGMLLSMQDVLDDDFSVLDGGLVPDDLQGIKTEQKRDGIIIINHLRDYLDRKNLPEDKKNIMLDSFKMSISLDAARDVPINLDKAVDGMINGQASITKQIFTYLYFNVYTAINLTGGALDIMAEMYSTFLKYALSDGASLGKVLTPPYITTLMAKLLDVNKKSKVMDIATGSAAFLVAAMEQMISDVNKTYGKNTSAARKAITSIKEEQLLGIEIDAKMYTLAASNMILRGDGSTQIKKMDTFTTPESVFDDFNADVLLLNPPFSYAGNGLPFFKFGLDHMKKGGYGAVIIQDSVGAGKTIEITTAILEKHRMIASIKMPMDLFEPNATVQTSIYIFKAGTPHNFDYDIVKFIDFRNDGYKRTERCIKEIDYPTERYQDIYLVYKLGFNAVKNSEFHSELWDLKKVYCEDTISKKGDDWNFEKHIEISNKPEEKSYLSSIDHHLSWDIENWILTQINAPFSEEAIEYLIQKEMKEFEVSKVFNITKTSCSYNKEDLKKPTDDIDVYDYITRTVTNRGICDITGFIDSNGLNEEGTYSLGLLQMAFFYRERAWYGGQFMRVVSCKYKIDKYAGLYLETILNGLSEKLLSGLVRDVDKTFLKMKVLLPVNNDGEIDFEWMSHFAREREKNIIRRFFSEYHKED
ncbi:MAG: N-6 DNA methylase [Lachnospiraceae bacterium]|nr:N-6 DNA methylase [Lachnospiraceae bacterium]